MGTSWLCTAGLLANTLYVFRFLSRTGMYATIVASQVTIWSIHIANVVALRLALSGGAEDLPSRAELGLCACWAVFSWGCRGWNPSVFSLLFLGLEGCAAIIELSPRVLGALFAVQLLVVAGFWAGICAASRSDTLTFMALDRHLHLGPRHMSSSAAAQCCFLHELSGHFAAQALFATILWPHMGPISDLPPVVLDLACAFGAYSVITVAMAAALPPHELPYNLGALPAGLRRPLPLPGPLRGGGASCEALRPLWWMQVPRAGGGSRKAA